VEVHGGNKKLQAPHYKYGEKGEKDVTGYDRNHPEYVRQVIELGKGNRMDEEQKGHHVATDKKGVKEIGKKTRGKSRQTIR
jgi:hypothetical protein